MTDATLKTARESSWQLTSLSVIEINKLFIAAKAIHLPVRRLTLYSDFIQAGLRLCIYNHLYPVCFNELRKLKQSNRIPEAVIKICANIKGNNECQKVTV